MHVIRSNHVTNWQYARASADDRSIPSRKMRTVIKEVVNIDRLAITRCYFIKN